VVNPVGQKNVIHKEVFDFAAGGVGGAKVAEPKEMAGQLVGQIEDEALFFARQADDESSRRRGEMALVVDGARHGRVVCATGRR